MMLLQEDTMKLSDFLEEAAIMKEMKHPNLVQVTTTTIIIIHFNEVGNIAYGLMQKLMLHNAYLKVVICATHSR